MFALIARMLEILRRPSATPSSPAHTLFERAEARAGLGPQQARELRRAARAYLSVVR